MLSPIFENVEKDSFRKEVDAELSNFIKEYTDGHLAIQMEDPLLRKAYRIEEKAQHDYATFLVVARNLGLGNTEIISVLRRIYVETTIHMRLVEAIMEAMKDLEKLKNLEISKGEEESLLRELRNMKNGEIIRYFARSHLELESDMVEIYQDIADRAVHPIFQQITEAIRDNEVEHHKLLEDLIREA